MGWLATLRLWFATVRPRESVRERHERLTEGARRKAEREGVLFDAYPGVPKQAPRLRLVILGGPYMQPVDLDGYSLHELKLRNPRRGARVLEQIIVARAELEQRLGAETIER